MNRLLQESGCEPEGREDTKGHLRSSEADKLDYHQEDLQREREREWETVRGHREGETVSRTVVNCPHARLRLWQCRQLSSTSM